MCSIQSHSGPVEDCSLSQVARHIARAAARLFATKGYDATPVRSIVEAAGVTKPTLYYHFGSKEGLANALLTKPLNDLLDQLKEIQTRPISPTEQLSAIFEAKFAFCREDPDRARFVYALLFGPLGAGLAGEIERLGQALDSAMIEVSSKLADAGLIDRDRVAAFASACRGMVIVSTVDYLYKGQEFEPSLGKTLVAQLLEGFSCREPRAVSKELPR